MLLFLPLLQFFQWKQLKYRVRMVRWSSSDLKSPLLPEIVYGKCVNEVGNNQQRTKGIGKKLSIILVKIKKKLTRPIRNGFMTITFLFTSYSTFAMS